jgi:hypothetical protein
MGSGSGGGNTTVTQKNEIPQYLQDFSQENIDVVRGIAQRGFPLYPGQRIADPSGFTNAAQQVQRQQDDTYNQAYGSFQGVIDALRGQMGSQYGQPGAAQQTAPNAGAGTYGQPLPGVQGAGAGSYGLPAPVATSFGQPVPAAQSFGQTMNPGQIAPWMSPFVEMALQPQLRAAQRQGAATGRQLQGQAAAAGAFGDARTGVEMGENTRNTNTLLSDITGQGYQSAYDRAVSAAQNAFGQNAGQFNTEQQAQLARYAAGAGQFNTEAEARLRAYQAGAGQFNTEDAARRAAAAQNNAALLAQYQAGAGQFNTEDAARRAATDLNSRIAALNNAANLDVYKTGAGQFNADRAAQLATGQGIQDALKGQQGYSGNLMQQLYASGQIDETQRQKPFDLAYQDFINQFEYPQEMLNLRLATGQGVPYSTTRLTTSPGPSQLGQAAGSLAALYGLFGRPAGQQGTDYSQIANLIAGRTTA